MSNLGENKQKSTGKSKELKKRFEEKNKKIIRRSKARRKGYEIDLEEISNGEFEEFELVVAN